MTPGFAKTREEMPWLPYRTPDVQVINAHNFGGPDIVLGWEAPVDIDTVGDSIVSTAGTLVIARNCGESASRTVNGVAFTGQVGTGNMSSGVSLTSLYKSGGVGVAFEGLLDSFSYGSGQPRTFSVPGLTIGATYLLQVFGADDRSATTAAYQSTYTVAGYTSAGCFNGPGHSAICRFVAGSTTEVVSIAHSSVSVINGFQVRQIA